VNTNSNRLTYDLSRGEITYEANTIAQIHDVSGASSAATGMGLIYNSANTTWEARQRDYLTLTMWGDINNTYFDTLGNRNLLSTTAGAWDTSPTAPTSLALCQRGNASYSNTTGVITLDPSKSYMTDIIISFSLNTSGVTHVIDLYSTTLLATSKLYQSTNIDFGGYVTTLAYVVSNIPSIRYEVYFTDGTVDGNTAQSTSNISLKIIEI
jgi:hypothetical protein